MTTAAAPPDVNPFARSSAADSPLRPAGDAVAVVRVEHQEDLLTRMIEHQAAKVPSSVFLFASLCAMAVSLGHQLAGNDRASRFVGMWVSPLLTMGLYNKMVKTFGAK